MTHCNLPAVAELLTIRQGRIQPTEGVEGLQRSSSVVCIDDEAEGSVATVRLLTSAAPAALTSSSAAAASATAVDASASACPLVCVRSAAASSSVSQSLVAIPAVRWAFPIAVAADAQAEQKRLAAWTKQTRLTAARVVLHITVTENAAAVEMSADRILTLDKLGSVWMVQQQQAAAGTQADLPDSRSHALLQSLLAHSSLPVLFVAPLQPSASVAATSAAFRWLDSLEALQGLNKLHVAFAISTVTTAAVPSAMCTLTLPLLTQHWTALKRREEYRAQKRKVEEDAAVQPARPAQPASSSAASASAAVAATSAAPAQFYRAAFTPTTMFYRISISFAPSLVVSDLLCHAVLQEGLRSLLGSIGAAKCTFQLLHWSSDTETGIVSTSSEMSVGARAAWMLMGSYQQKSCRIDVLQQSAFLMALAS